MTRLVVLGPPGAGKSWLAMRLAALLDVPCHDLDDLYWLPGWRRPSEARWKRTLEDLTAGDAWVVAGNFQPTVETRLRRADAAVILNPGTMTCLRGLLLRTVRIYLGKTELLPERLRPGGRFRAHHGLLHVARIAVRYRRDSLARTLELAAFHRVPVLELRGRVSPQEVVRHLNSVIRTQEAGV